MIHPPVARPDTTPSTASGPDKLPLAALTALVVGSMIGSGIFASALPDGGQRRAPAARSSGG